MPFLESEGALNQVVCTQNEVGYIFRVMDELVNSYIYFIQRCKAFFQFLEY